MSEISTPTASAGNSSSDDSAPFKYTKGLIQLKFPTATDFILNTSTHEALNFLRNNRGFSTEELISSLHHIEFFNIWDMTAIMQYAQSKKQPDEVEKSASISDGSSRVQTVTQDNSPENILSELDTIDNEKKQEFNEKLSVENSLLAEEYRNVQSAIAQEKQRVQSAMASISNFYPSTKQRTR